MKKLLIVLFVLAAFNTELIGTVLHVEPITKAEAAIKRIGGYTRSNGTRVKSHYRDTSNDGNSWNNANTLGYND